MRRWRRNADVDLRLAQREGFSSPREHARWLLSRLRAGQLHADTIAAAAYLGHPAAKLAVRMAEINALPLLREPPWSTRTDEIFQKAPIDQKRAVLQVADCVTRAVNAFLSGEQFGAAAAVIEGSRAWVLGETLEDPWYAADVCQSREMDVQIGSREEAYALRAAALVGYGCRQPPAIQPDRFAEACMRARDSMTGRRGPGPEAKWQDKHFAMNLLAEEWTMVPLEERP